ncbi:hypothetical protein PO124_09830 [Bacillus licheniformis]|nr:hypothetical protein [Bacillus licheniformis]
MAPAEDGADISEASGDMIGFNFDLGAWKMGSCQLNERMQQIGFVTMPTSFPFLRSGGSRFRVQKDG